MHTYYLTSVLKLDFSALLDDFKVIMLICSIFKDLGEFIS